MVLTIRVPAETGRRLATVARRRRRTRSEVAREFIESALAGAAQADPHAEARRQSQLASAHAAESEALHFVNAAADLRGWK
jgi:predicted transcriptional regulator